MTRYYFHIQRSGMSIQDLEGEAFATADQAVAEARRSAKEIVAIATVEERLIDTDRIDIFDEADVLVGTIHMIDVLPIRKMPTEGR